MDPTLDRTPPRGYICKICKRSGHHFIQLCPFDHDYNSITQRRRRSARANGRTSQDRLAEYSPDFWNDRRSRFQGDLSPTGIQPHGRCRSRSPFRRIDRKYERDRPASYQNHSGKRKATGETPPRDSVPQNKICTQDSGEVQEVTRKKVGFDNVVVYIPPKQEGRLSYYDEPNGDEPTVPLAMGVTKPLGHEKMDVDTPEMPSSEKSVSLDGDEDDCLGMIRTESDKTNLLLLVNGIEYPRKYSTCVAEFLRGRQIWVNESIMYTRSCPADFFGPPVAAEQLACWEAECEPMVNKGLVGEMARDFASADEAAGLATNVVAADSTKVGAEEDATMDDAGSTALAGGSMEKVKLMMFATESLQICEPLPAEEHKTATEAMAYLGDEPPAECGTQQPAQTKEESSTEAAEYSISYVSPSACKAVEVKINEAQPSQPKEDTAMEAELIPMPLTTVQTSVVAGDGESLVNPSAEDQGDSEMTDVGFSQVVKGKDPNYGQPEQETFSAEPRQVVGEAGF